MAGDKTLHAAIAKQLKANGRLPRGPRLLRHRPPEILPTPREALPKLDPPHKPRVQSSYQYHAAVLLVRINAKLKWRFMRAAYAQGKHASELVRELMQQAIDAYESTLPMNGAHNDRDPGNTAA
jgi:hypothetical protein